MAGRVQGLCRIVAESYGGDASRLWREAGTAAELHRRLTALPGFGPLKGRIVTGVLARHFGVRPPGWEEIAPDFPTLADVTTADERRAYQAGKRAQKAAMRAEAGARSGARAAAERGARRRPAAPGGGAQRRQSRP
jgi:uncharacterized HhH-GPD family protein